MAKVMQAIENQRLDVRRILEFRVIPSRASPLSEDYEADPVFRSPKESRLSYKIDM